MSSNARRQTRPTKKATPRNRKALPRTARPQTRTTKPGGLALSLTLLATLVAGSCVSRLSAPDASGVAHRPGAAGANLAAPSRTPETGQAAPGGSDGSAGQPAPWRPDDAAPRAESALHMTPPPPPSPTPAPAAAPGTVTINRVPGEWVSWALLNRSTGGLVTGGDSGTNSTESMVKAWIAADYLRGLGSKEPGTDEIDLLRRMIRDSDDQAAQKLYLRRGGDAIISRLISTCGLTDTRLYPGWWSLTQISARDAVRMGDCIADGRATNGRWTAWLLGEMRQVRGEGRFGIVEVRPGVAVKNGWTKWWNGTWHVNCLGVADGWSLAVLIRYPSGSSLANSAEVCRSVTRQLAP
jgi:hypothetical protein